MQLTAIRLGDSAQSWQDAGFTIASTDGSTPAACTAIVSFGRTRIELTGSGGGFLGWAFGDDAGDGSTAKAAGSSIAATDLDGLPFLEALALPPSPKALAPHANGIVSIDHVVIQSPDMRRTTEAFATVGLTPAGGRTTDSYGSSMQQRFFWAGDLILEMVGPLQKPLGDSDNAADQLGEHAPATMFGLALVSRDLKATGDFLGDLLGEPKEAVQAGRTIAGLRGKETGISIPIAVMSPHVKDG